MSRSKAQNKRQGRLSDLNATKHLFISFGDSTILKIPIDIQDPSDKTIDYIKNEIQHKIGRSDFEITNLDKKIKKASHFNDKAIINIAFKNKCYDIKFSLPSKKDFTLENSYNIDFDHIILGLQKGGFFSSDLCKKNCIFLTIWNTKINKNNLKLDFIPPGALVNVELDNEKAILIQFKGKNFSFQIGELISKAEKFIQQELKLKAAKICSDNPKSKAIQLAKGIKYSISSLCSYTFIGPNGKPSSQKLEFNATVLDAKKLLAALYSNNQELTAEDIIIYNDKNEVITQNILLNKLEVIRFDIINNKNETIIPNDNIGKVIRQQKKKNLDPSTPPKGPTQTPTNKPKSKSSMSDRKKEASKVKNTNQPQPSTQNPPKKDSKASNPLTNPPAIKSLPPKEPAKPTPTKKTKPPAPAVKPNKTPTPLSPAKKSNIKGAKPETKPIPAVKETKPEDETPKLAPKKKALHVKISTTEVKGNEDDDNDTNKAPSGPSLDIHFIFEDSVGTNIDPIKREIEIDTTMEEISSVLSKKYSIPGIVEIKYKDGDEKITIDKEMTIDDVRDDMVQKDSKSGKSKNVLYVGSRQPKPSNTDNKPKRKNYKPKLKNVEEDAPGPLPKPVYSNPYIEDHYLFEFDEEEKDISLKKESLLEEHVDLIKKKYRIDENEEIGFKVLSLEDCDKSEAESEGEVINDLNQKMKNFEDKKIIVYLKNESAESLYLTVKRMKAPTAVLRTYHYMTNLDDTEYEIELDTKATVKSIKRAIHRNKDFCVHYLSNIKVLFAGKDLLDDLVLENLGIGNALLYIYIRSSEDILLMTAKALQVDNDDDYEYYDDD